MAKYKVDLNNENNLRDLLQETYRLADEQIIQAQTCICKLISSTKLESEPMDSKAKYNKSINDYLTIKDKAIRSKLDIAKLLSEIINHNGDIANTMNSADGQGATIDIDKIRQMINEKSEESEEDKIITLKK